MNDETGWREVRRVPRSHDQARASYDRLARWFDIFEEPFERPARRRGLGLLAPRAGETILEVGFGTGHDLVELARAVGPGGHVLGLDLSPKMCAIARRRVHRADLDARVTLSVGDAVAMPYEAASVDAVVLSFTLELFDTPEIPVVLGECRRVLRPEGRLAAVSLVRGPSPSRAVRLYERVHDLAPGLVDCRPIPVAAALAEAGLAIERAVGGSLWGLPVSAVLAVRPS